MTTSLQAFWILIHPWYTIRDQIYTDQLLIGNTSLQEPIHLFYDHTFYQTRLQVPLKEEFQTNFQMFSRNLNAWRIQNRLF